MATSLVEPGVLRGGACVGLGGRDSWILEGI